ncbi:hypothetical protein TNCV_3398561 [Trichonephila clavipes]|nr:hypothetical protein TNCV_3398561 [Trichonephila clavipes]
MLKEGTIIPIQSQETSPVVVCRKNNGLPPDNPEAHRFVVEYRKLTAITKYTLPLIDDLIMSLPHTAIMSALDLRNGDFQLAVNPSDIVKTAFVTKNGTHFTVCHLACQRSSQFSDGNRHHTKTTDREVCECVHGWLDYIVSISH